MDLRRAVPLREGTGMSSARRADVRVDFLTGFAECSVVRASSLRGLANPSRSPTRCPLRERWTGSLDIDEVAAGQRSRARLAHHRETCRSDCCRRILRFVKMPVSLQRNTALIDGGLPCGSTSSRLVRIRNANGTVCLKSAAVRLELLPFRPNKNGVSPCRLADEPHNFLLTLRCESLIPFNQCRSRLKSF